MPPYHTVSGSDITVYLDIKVDTAEDFTMGLPLEGLLTEIAIKWKPIANAWNFRLIIAPRPAAILIAPNASPPDGTEHFANATPTNRILFHDTVLTPPSGVDYFKLKIGVKDSSRPETQSGRVSYVDYAGGSGYIYAKADEAPHEVGDISHELGHILGLADRYYEAIAWYSKHAVKRNCLQIRLDKWIDSDHNDMRVSIPGISNTTKDLPRYAERVPLLMSKKELPQDPTYDSGNNLMSNSSTTITKYQLDHIGLENGQPKPPREEPRIRKSNWVAILGDYDLAQPPFQAQPAWDGGKGLMFYNTVTQKDEPYPCWDGSKRGLDDKDEVFMPDLIEDAKGGAELITRLPVSSRRYKLVHRQTTLLLRNKMCYSKRLLNDLTK